MPAHHVRAVAIGYPPPYSILKGMANIRKSYEQSLLKNDKKLKSRLCYEIKG